MTILDLSTIPSLVVASFAVFRLAYFISSEAGPFWAAKKFRSMVKKTTPKSSHMDEGISCGYCVGLEASLLIMAYLFLPWRLQIIDSLIVILSVAGFAMVIHQLFVFLRRE